MKEADHPNDNAPKPELQEGQNEQQESSKQDTLQQIANDLLELKEKNDQETAEDLEMVQEIIDLTKKEVIPVRDEEQTYGDLLEELRANEISLKNIINNFSIDDAFDAMRRSETAIAKLKGRLSRLHQKRDYFDQEIINEQAREEKLIFEIDAENQKNFISRFFKGKKRDALSSERFQSINIIIRHHTNQNLNISRNISELRDHKTSLIKLRKELQHKTIEQFFYNLGMKAVELRQRLTSLEIQKQLNSLLLENAKQDSTNGTYDPIVDIVIDYQLLQEVEKFEKNILSQFSDDPSKYDYSQGETRVAIEDGLYDFRISRRKQFKNNFDEGPFETNRGYRDLLELGGIKKIEDHDSRQFRFDSDRWSVFKKFAIDSGCVPDELYEELEEQIINHIFEQRLRHAGDQDLDGTEAAQTMAIFNNPRAIPLYSQRIRESKGDSHVNNEVYHLFKKIFKNSNPEKVNTAFANLSNEDREILTLINDENSFLNILNKNTSGYSMCSKIRNAKQTIKEEGDLRLLAEAGWDNDRLLTYFITLADPNEELDKLIEIAEILNKSKTELIFEHFDSLFSRINYINSDSLSVIDRLTDRLAEELDISKKELLQKIATENPFTFSKNADRKIWIATFGEARVKAFLNILPEKSDEKRNAFTHNKYDRTSQFMIHLYTNNFGKLKLNEETFDIITQFVEKFGLSKTPILFKYFRNIILHETQGTELPQEQIEEGITSVKELEKRFKKLKREMYSKKPITEINADNFSAFEREVLSSATGKSTHSFDYERPKMDTIIEDWERNYSEGRIEDKSEEYKPAEILVSNIEIQVDKERIKNNFDVLRTEVMRAMEDSNDVSEIKIEAGKILETRIQELRTILDKKPNNKFIQAQFDELVEIAQNLESADNIDKTMESLVLLDTKFASKTGLVSIMRELLFRKMFTINFSPEMIRNQASKIEEEITGQAILNLINLVDTFIKEHVINIEGKNEEGYWSKSAWKTILSAKDNSKQIDITKLFKTHADALRAEVANFVITETGKPKQVQVIPDRGFVGEMSGYIANVCYTAEYPLLVKYPNVIPYKFVSENASGEKEFIGSVLIFELKDSENNKVMLVRGFDVPNESNLNIGQFIENFLDNLEKVAKQRGFSKIIIPGISGAISNYGMTLSYMKKFMSTERKISLNERFDFNGYDITNNCYLAREIKLEQST